MKNKPNNNGLRKRLKPQNPNTDKTELASNGKCSSGKNTKKLVERVQDIFAVEHFIERLGSLLRNSKIEWLREICFSEFKGLAITSSKDEEPEVETGEKHVSHRLSYFKMELIAALILVLCLTCCTRLYKVDYPNHVW